MTILDPVSAANLTVFLVQLPRSQRASRKQPAAPPPVELVCLEQARAAGEVVISETGVTERVRLENHSKRNLFLQAGEVLRGGDQDHGQHERRHERSAEREFSWQGCGSLADR